jgi:hypothetical protein
MVERVCEKWNSGVLILRRADIVDFFHPNTNVKAIHIFPSLDGNPTSRLHIHPSNEQGNQLFLAVLLANRIEGRIS